MKSRYFKRSEFACKCGCGFNAVDAGLLAVLEDIRGFFGQPVTITSGCRCYAHNKAVGGSKNSRHVQAIAADIKVKNISPDVVSDYIDQEHGNCALGQYDDWTHIDVRGNSARWDNRTNVL